MSNQIPSILFALDRIFEPREPKIETKEPIQVQPTILHTWCGSCGDELTYPSAGGICGRCAGFKYGVEE